MISDYILSELDLHPFVRQCARSSHERIDGAGYPDGLSGENIPLPARIVLVADALDALTSTRSYRAARPFLGALAEIRAHTGTQFCPRVVAALEELWRTEPGVFGASSLVAGVGLLVDGRHHHDLREAVRDAERRQKEERNHDAAGPGKGEEEAAHRGEPGSQPPGLDPFGDRTRECFPGDHAAGERRKRPAVAARTETQARRELRQRRIDEPGCERAKRKPAHDDRQRPPAEHVAESVDQAAALACLSAALVRDSNPREQEEGDPVAREIRGEPGRCTAESESEPTRDGTESHRSLLPDRVDPVRGCKLILLDGHRDQRVARDGRDHRDQAAETDERENDRPRARHHPHERTGDGRCAGGLAPDEHALPRQPVDERRRKAAPDDGRHEPDRHQQGNLRNRRGRLVHPADEHRHHQPVAEVRDALAEREPAERRRPERALEPLRHQPRCCPCQGSHLIDRTTGGAEAPPSPSSDGSSSSCCCAS